MVKAIKKESRVDNPVKKRFRKIVRKVIIVNRLFRIAIHKRRYRLFTNLKVQKGLYRLMMLIKMKHGRAESHTWKVKFGRASRKLRGILRIQKIINAERLNRTPQ